MKNYSTYVQEANILCSTLLEERETERHTQKILNMQNNVMHSDLTVYQNEFLLRQLNTIQEAAYA
jgi:hypothetical protein